MKKAFKFIESLNKLFISLCGYPTLKFFDDYCEVYFYVRGTIRDLEILKYDDADEFRMFNDCKNDCIVLVYTFHFPES